MGIHLTTSIYVVYTLLLPAPIDSHLQLSLRRLESWKHQVADITSRLVEVEAHPLAAKTLGDNVELQAIYSQYYSYLEFLNVLTCSR